MSLSICTVSSKSSLLSYKVWKLVKVKAKTYTADALDSCVRMFKSFLASDGLLFADNLCKQL